MKRFALSSLLLWPLLPFVAHAQTTPTLISLEYSADAGCPDAASFRAQVLSRTQRVSFTAPEHAHELTWSVPTSDTNGGSRGSLRVEGTKSGKLERHVTAATCEQVVSALSLVAALSVDPDAALAPREEPAPAPPAAPPTAAKPAATAEPEPRPKQATAPSGVRLSAGLSLTGQSGLAPRLVWAPRPFVGISFRSRGGYTWGLSLSASQTRGHAAASVGEADFTWSLARLEAFPIRLAYARWRLEPALFVEAGQVRARGAGVTPVAEVRRPALFAGGLARLGFLAFDLLLFEVEGGPLLALARDRFYLFENTTVFRVPRVTGFVAAGVGLEFL